MQVWPWKLLFRSISCHLLEKRWTCFEGVGRSQLVFYSNKDCIRMREKTWLFFLSVFFKVDIALSTLWTNENPGVDLVTDLCDSAPLTCWSRPAFSLCVGWFSSIMQIICGQFNWNFCFITFTSYKQKDYETTTALTIFIQGIHIKKQVWKQPMVAQCRDGWSIFFFK